MCQKLHHFNKASKLIKNVKIYDVQTNTVMLAQCFELNGAVIILMHQFGSLRR